MGKASQKARLYVGLLGLLLTLLLAACGPTPEPTRVRPTAANTAVPVMPSPTTTAQPGVTVSPTTALRHTSTPVASATSTATQVASATPTATATATVTPTSSPTSTPPAASGRGRVCAGVAQGTFSDYPWGTRLPGWYLDWRVHAAPTSIPGTEHAQMVRLSGETFYPDLATVQAAAQARPGSLWLIGNEPDVTWQDNVPPAAYAATYHTLYAALKAADPTARVAIGAVSQVTPLRLRYLEEVLAAYQAQFGVPMPVDIWNIHVFVLREEPGSWGVGLPPGMEDATDGTLWNIEDHARVELVEAQVRTFRRWMAARGEGAKPLIISEYGILMPADYGFPPDVVAAFLRGTFDYFSQAEDPNLGDPADDHRLVQRWCWYSAADTEYPTGDLFTVEDRQPTDLWPTFAAYLR